MKAQLGIIYRRRIIGNIHEEIEIILNSSFVNKKIFVDTFNNFVKVSFIKIEDNTLIYYVELPKELGVIPPDWRDLAYEHVKVEKLVYTSVMDNLKLSGFIFEPLNADSIRNLKNILSIALKDLGSVIDLISVEIDTNEQASDQVNIVVLFDYKNGETKQLIIPFNMF